MDFWQKSLIFLHLAYVFLFGFLIYLSIIYFHLFIYWQVGLSIIFCFTTKPCCLQQGSNLVNKHPWASPFLPAPPLPIRLLYDISHVSHTGHQ